MKNFVAKNIRYLMTALGIVVGIFTAANWSSMPVLQRLDALILGCLILHVWEESLFGFTAMISSKLSFTQNNPHFGEMITSAIVLIFAFVPLFFPAVVFLGAVPLLVGALETVAHLAAIRMSEKRFYSPGLVTSVLLMLPIAVYGIVHVARNGLMPPVHWLLSLVYLFAGLLIAQRIVVTSSGMKYSEFLKNARGALFDKREK